MRTSAAASAPIDSGMDGAAADPPVVAGRSSSVPHAPQPGHRPTQRAVCWAHSEHA
jgi:hypothetical protein